MNHSLFIDFVCQKLILFLCKFYVVSKCDRRTYFPSCTSLLCHTLCGFTCVSIKDNDGFSILLVHIIAVQWKDIPKGRPSRPRDSVNEYSTIQRKLMLSLRNWDIWAFHSHSPNSISKSRLVWLEQHKWRIKESSGIATQFKLENGFHVIHWFQSYN